MTRRPAASGSDISTITARPATVERPQQSAHGERVDDAGIDREVEVRARGRRAPCPAITASAAHGGKFFASLSPNSSTAAVVDSTGWMLSTTLMTVGLPCLSASVNRTAPTAEPAMPENSEPGDGAAADAAELVKSRDDEREGADDEDDVLPEHEDVGVREQVVERDAPGGLGAPERRAERDEPGTDTRLARLTHGMTIHG